VDIALLLIRLLLVAVFAVAGVAKLADRAGSRQAMSDFGVPKSLAAPFGALLALAELAVAVALLPAATAWWGALGALALLILFVVGIGANLARGRKPDCRCFGQLHSAPAGWSTLARNAVLAALAAFVVLQGYGGAGPGALSWLGNLSASGLLVLLFGLAVLGLVGAQWWFLVQLLRQNGRLLGRLQALEARLGVDGAAPAPSGNGSRRAEDGLPVGTLAPAFKLPDLDDEEVTLDDLRAEGKPVALIFTSPDCTSCTELLPDIRHWQEEYAEMLTIALISHLSAEENRAKVAEHGVGPVLLQEDWEVAELYLVEATPTAVLIRSDGVIASSLEEGADYVEDLVETAARHRSQLPILPSHGGHGAQEEAAPEVPEGLQVGEPVPEDIPLATLEGEKIELADYIKGRGRDTLLLFWRTDCGHCEDMLPDLKAWEVDPPEGAPELLVVSRGKLQENKEIDVRSPVVLDNRFKARDAFGVYATPLGVLVDAEGKVASELAIGASPIMQLATGTASSRRWPWKRRWPWERQRS
jgi:methylamine dehydrogenase accessory protein MauD